MGARELSSLRIGRSQQRIVFSPLVLLLLFWASTTYPAALMLMTQTGKKSIFTTFCHLLSIVRKEVSVTAFVHPDYDQTTTNNDIALLKLAESVDVSIHTPACIPAATADYVGQTAKVYGEKISQNSAFQPLQRQIALFSPCLWPVGRHVLSQFFPHKTFQEGQKYNLLHIWGKLMMLTTPWQDKSLISYVRYRHTKWGSSWVYQRFAPFSIV